MNILHLSAVKNWGGGENHIENLCKELQSIAPEVNNSIFCIENGAFQQRLKTTNIHVLPAKLRFKMDPRYFLKLIQVCKIEKIDLIHIHDSTALTLCIMADYLYDLPPFIFSKKTSFPIRLRKQTLYKYNYVKIKRILCVSQATKEITAHSIRNPEKLVCIYHGTGIKDKSTQTTFSLRDRLKLDNNIRIIGNVANHIWPKNLETFILVANELINNQGRKNLHFVQIGAYSNLTKNLLLDVERLKLQGHVSFLDQIPQASNFIPQFDISLITSESEGVPQFIYESFYHEIPVISTNVGGISEVIEHGKNGLLAPAFDFMQLAEHIVTLQKNSGLRGQFTSVSKVKLHQSFTTGIMTQKTLVEYKNVLNGRF